jgi:hypothetical protein
MKQFDSPVRGNMLHMRSLRDEHNGSKACNDADPRPTRRNRVRVWLFCHDASNPGCSVSYLALSYNQDFPPETICSGGRALGISENLAW